MLSESERESVDAWWESEWPEENVDVLDTLAATVDQIAAARAKAALEAAAESIDAESKRHMFAATNRLRPFKDRDQAWGAQIASERAARIVRAAIPKNRAN
jgi:class 3 adenylate cyclase